MGECLDCVGDGQSW